jgi:hypothetical protein
LRFPQPPRSHRTLALDVDDAAFGQFKGAAKRDSALVADVDLAARAV